MNKHQFGISLKVNEAISGQDAYVKVKGWNKLNADTLDGYEFDKMDVVAYCTPFDTTLNSTVSRCIRW
jgi:hypothetical protein